MQQNITFRIEVSCGFLDIKENIVSIIKSYNYDTFLGKEATSKRINDWIDNIVFSTEDQSSGTIENCSDSTMYLFDYTVLFPDLFYDIADACPAACFCGHSEYYNDDCGVMEEHNFSNTKNERKEENAMKENYTKEELIDIIGKILKPLTEEEIVEVCESIDVDAERDDIPVAIYDEAVECFDESLDGIMEYIYNNLINAVISVAGEIIYDVNWNGRRN